MLFYLYFPLHLCSNTPVKNAKCNFYSQQSRVIVQIGKELLQNKNFINAPSTKLNSLFTCRETNHVKWEHAPRVNHIIHHCWLIVKTAVGDQNKHRKIMLLHRGKIHGRAEIRNFSASVEKYFTSSLRSLVQYFSTLADKFRFILLTREEKFRISKRPCNVLFIL